MEIWRVIPSYPQYEVSNFGRVRELTGRLLKPVPNKKGYIRACMNGVAPQVHWLVLEAFVGPRPAGAMGRHLNDIPGDNRLENLAWGTQTENMADAKRNGLIRHKLTPDQVQEMRRLYREGVSKTRLAERFGITHGSVRWRLKEK